MGFIGLVSACGVAPEQCAVSDNHFGKGVPKDLGNELVLNTSSGSYGNNRTFLSFSNYSVIDCRTGEEKTFVLEDIFESNRGTDGGQTDTSPVAIRPRVESGDAGDQLLAYLNAGNFESLSEIAAKAEELGIVVREQTNENEDCGCAAFYPRLLGDKEPAPERNA